MNGQTAKQEWVSSWTLPFTAMVGMSGSTLFAFSSGVFMDPMTAEFGWSRTQFAAAFAIQTLFSLFLLPFLGRLVDKIGPRRVALIGGTCFIAAFSLLAAANGSIVQWWTLCAVLALVQATITQAVWVTAVITRFHASRGLAMAVALTGLGLGSMIWPIVTALYIQNLGWRSAFLALALSWGAIALPLTVLFFSDGRDRSAARGVRKPIPPYRQDLLSRTFISLAIAGGLFSCAYYGLMVHFVSILRGGGLSLNAAAGIAGLVGAFSMAGRITTGYLLDRFSARKIGGFVFLMPIGVVLLLGCAQGSVPLSIFAAALLGVASGAEIDIVTIVVARRFRQEVFASIYAIFMGILAVCASFGPTLAGALFDASKSYTPYLLAVVPMAIVSAALIVSIKDVRPDPSRA